MPIASPSPFVRICKPTGTAANSYSTKGIQPIQPNFGTMGGSKKGPVRDAPAPVGSYRPNAWGLYDMHGNLREWCEDWHCGYYYENSPTVNPTGPTTGSSRLQRGGSFNYGPDDCRSAERFFRPPDATHSPIWGFRVAIPVEALKR